MKTKYSLYFCSFSVRNIFISFTFLLFSFNSLFAQDCPVITEEGVFNPNTDVLITSYHQSMAKTPTGFVAWGEDMAANGGDATTITEVIPANGYTYSGTPIHFTVSGNSDGQAFLATTSSLYVWGGLGEVVDGSFATGPGFNDMNTTQALPFIAADITQLHASSDVLFVLSSGQVWVATTGTTAPTGNASGNGNIWQQVQTSSGVPLTGVVNVTGNKYAGYAQLNNGDIYTWGDNVVLGDGSGIQDLNYATLMTAPPVSVTYISSFTHNDNDTGLLALGSDTKIYGVGDNTLGELISTGTGVVTTWTAIQDGSGNDFTGAIQLSTSHTSEEWAGAAVVTVGAAPSDPNLLYTWGLNNNNSLGQGGNATIGDPTIPPSFTVGTDDPIAASVGGHATTFFNRANGGSICFVGHIIQGSTGGLTTGDGSTFECVIPATVELCGTATILDITAVNDSGTVNGLGGIAISNVLANDDLDGSIATLATVYLTQISTSNPGVTLDLGTGAVNASASIPAGIYTIEYKICEVDYPTNCTSAIAVVTVLPDIDGDGILDQDDLDDDNDGILDSDEQSILDCTTGVSPLFGSAQGPNNYLGSDINNPSVGDSFLYTNVYSGVDAIITIVSSTDTAIVDLDVTTTGLDENFQPQINHIDNNSFTEFRIDFVISGTSTPSPVNNFVVTTIDNDVNEFVVYADGHTSNLYVDSPTEELIYTGAAISAGFSEGYISNGNVIGGIPVDAPEFHVAGVYSAVNSVSFRFGSSSGDTSNHSITLLPCIPRDFWTTVPDLYVDIDTDGDGIPNRLDTDSDNDGCFDALEGNGGVLISQLDTNGAIDIANVTPSGVDANGVPNLVSGGQADVSSLNNLVQGLQCQADLSLTKTIDNATPKIGETITYTITVTNSGPSSTTGVQVQDILPAGLFYDSGSSVIPGGTSYDDSTGIWDLSTETINNGASYILQIAAKITPACGELTNVAQIINSDKQDPDSITNNGN